MANQQYGCTDFPFSTDSSTNSLSRTTGINQTIAACIRLFLLTGKGSRVGSKKGSILETLLHNLLPTSSLTEEQDILKKELEEEFPGVNFTRVELVRELVQAEDTNKTIISSLRLNISFNTAATSITQLSIDINNG